MTTTVKLVRQIHLKCKSPLGVPGKWVVSGMGVNAQGHREAYNIEIKFATDEADARRQAVEDLGFVEAKPAKGKKGKS